MACKTSCQLCNHLVVSTSIAYDPDANTLNIFIPERAYANCEKVCIVVAQAIPAATQISSLVQIVVGTSPFALVRCSGAQVTACEIRTRTRYSTHVITNTTSGVFKLDGKVSACVPSNLEALPVA